MLSEKQKEQVKATVPVLKENGVALTDYFYKRMLKNNPDLKETFNMGHQRSGAQAKALAGAVLAYAENIDNPGVLAPVIELICHKHVSLNIQTPDYGTVGENLLHSISEVLNISMDDELIRAWAEAYQQLADIFIATEKQLYEEHKNTSGSWVGWRDFIVDRKVMESAEITSFYLVPKDRQALPPYKPGQYITLRVMVPALGIRQPRQYSLSSSPADNYLRISVKREDPRIEGQDPGYVSSTLHNAVQEGDIVELSAPTGNFYLLNPDNTNVLISAGVGLTPMISMVNHLLAEHADPNLSSAAGTGDSAITEKQSEGKKDIYFIHAARSSEAHALREELENLARRNRNLHLFIAYENVKEGEVAGKNYHMQGRLKLDEMPAACLPKEADYYLCGPVPFMQEQYQALLRLGIPPERIFSEAFTTGGVHL
ncbi:globin domain-containing protein [Pantoea piersonii]|jgi:nitric oxide dioxygenase|uniref:globin domain-containing protein n=1 Tax=Pantoea piersonii TaxID=2364647 RepID=UPI000EA1644C|nr:globin domain-containing protein [Pantoea piersonii]MBZ6388710.1 nitric oxide dioxygenase [Pantoea piersonii]MBZ6402503.1 nitric oxide dioxygenase [Pantoea piersonii]MBZ6410693.1 nitric oxide dioxygenase [Pantoea piersonii]MBZ6427253.1 nitric oxide dioxygenase [Pantoea piersonii]NYB05016.1 nitric oxide dioxygenase [Pantoea piersonii]